MSASRISRVTISPPAACLPRATPRPPPARRPHEATRRPNPRDRPRATERAPTPSSSVASRVPASRVRVATDAPRGRLKGVDDDDDDSNDADDADDDEFKTTTTKKHVIQHLEGVDLVVAVGGDGTALSARWGSSAVPRAASGRPHRHHPARDCRARHRACRLSLPREAGRQQPPSRSLGRVLRFHLARAARVALHSVSLASRGRSIQRRGGRSAACVTADSTLRPPGGRVADRARAPVRSARRARFGLAAALLPSHFLPHGDVPLLGVNSDPTRPWEGEVGSSRSSVVTEWKATCGHGRARSALRGPLLSRSGRRCVNRMGYCNAWATSSTSSVSRAACSFACWWSCVRFGGSFRRSPSPLVARPRHASSFVATQQNNTQPKETPRRRGAILARAAAALGESLRDEAARGG